MVADGDPIVPPVEIYVEADPEVELDGLADRLHAPGGALHRHAARSGPLPFAEHKTRIVHRTARGDPLPPAVESPRRRIQMTVSSTDQGVARIVSWDRQERRNAWTWRR